MGCAFQHRVAACLPWLVDYDPREPVIPIRSTVVSTAPQSACIVRSRQRHEVDASRPRVAQLYNGFRAEATMAVYSEFRCWHLESARSKTNWLSANEEEHALTQSMGIDQVYKRMDA